MSGARLLREGLARACAEFTAMQLTDPVDGTLFFVCPMERRSPHQGRVVVSV